MGMDHAYATTKSTSCYWCGHMRDDGKTTARRPRAEFDAYEEGRRDAIADVVAWMRGNSTPPARIVQGYLMRGGDIDDLLTELGERIKRGDANGARHG